jgi:hypothetical protein
VLEQRRFLAIIGEQPMLNHSKQAGARILAIGAALALAPILAACGSQSATDTTADTGAQPPAAAPAAAGTADAICSALALTPQVLGDDNKVEIVRAGQVQPELLNNWLSKRAADGGPQVSLKDYPDLAGADLTLPLTVCLFKTPTARNIPVPDDIRTVANGIRVIAANNKVFTIDAIDAIGDVDRLASQVDDLLPRG